MVPKKICIVSCTAHKRAAPMRAENLYSSELFYKSRRYAQASYDAWLVLSAKHGLVEPCEILAPYDCKLTTLSLHKRRSLAEQISHQAIRLFKDRNVQISSICGEEYDHLLGEAGIPINRKPEFSLPIGKKLKALGAITDPNNSQPLLESTYNAIWRLIKRSGLRRLKDVMDSGIPDSGIYLFFDERERRLKDIDKLRIVRIGTHGVASGSKASLRNRIRTHFGTASGEGNHRSSIFRLHTGRSLINAKLAPAIGTWGLPTADKNSLLAERELEQAVSKYLADLYVLLIAVPGVSDKNNDRSYLEQNLIALLSNGCKPLDPPSCDWLGLNSAKREIRKSGLWNVNHVQQSVDPGYLEILEYYVSVTAGNKPVPRKQLAPRDWQARARDDARQLTLL
ncbi:MAG TPA: hypothetical protein VNW15_15110 [Rhizomicrobium sp.]|jgi:hypothetical protein|nr:hypothetical protein [Rhizomicrobium sp.]